MSSDDLSESSSQGSSDVSDSKSIGKEKENSEYDSMDEEYDAIMSKKKYEKKTTVEVLISIVRESCSGLNQSSGGFCVQSVCCVVNVIISGLWMLSFALVPVALVLVVPLGIVFLVGLISIWARSMFDPTWLILAPVIGCLGASVLAVCIPSILCGIPVFVWLIWFCAKLVGKGLSEKGELTSTKFRVKEPKIRKGDENDVEKPKKEREEVVKKKKKEMEPDGQDVVNVHEVQITRSVEDKMMSSPEISETDSSKSERSEESTDQSDQSELDDVFSESSSDD